MNKGLRFMRIKSMLTNSNMLSINQMHAQVKLTEMWKAVHYKNYPLNIGKLQPANNGRETRGVTERKLVEPTTLNTFIGNATGLCFHKVSGTKYW